MNLSRTFRVKADNLKSDHQVTVQSFCLLSPRATERRLTAHSNKRRMHSTLRYGQPMRKHFLIECHVTTAHWVCSQPRVMRLAFAPAWYTNLFLPLLHNYRRLYVQRSGCAGSVLQLRFRNFSQHLVRTIAEILFLCLLTVDYARPSIVLFSQFWYRTGINGGSFRFQIHFSTLRFKTLMAAHVCSYFTTRPLPFGCMTPCCLLNNLAVYSLTEYLFRKSFQPDRRQRLGHRPQMWSVINILNTYWCGWYVITLAPHLVSIAQVRH